MDLLIRLIIWIVKAVYKEIQSTRTHRDLTKEGLDPALARERPGVPATQIRQELSQGLQRQRAQLEQLLLDADRALDQVVILERDLPGMVGTKVLLDVVSEQVRPALDAGLPTLRAAVAQLRSAKLAEAQQLMGRAGLVPVMESVRSAVVHASVLSLLRDSRASTEDGHRLADADAIADALLAPIQQFASDQDIALPAELPVTAPAIPGGESIWFGLLPKRYPVLFVPADFLSDLYRYASVPHELGHLLWRDTPGLAREVYAASEFQLQQGLLRVQEGRIAGTLDQIFTPWMSEIFADFVAVQLLGPAAVRGLIHSFAQPDAPLAVTTAGARGNAYDEHPPAHLRVLWTCHQLWTMGFDQQAKALQAEWSALHADPQHIRLPLQGGAVAQFPLETLAAPGRELVGRLYERGFTTLSGFRLADIPGFEMSPGLWAHVLRRAEALSEDKAFQDDGRVVLAAAIMARTKHPARALVITRGLRRAIRGRDVHERALPDAHYEHAGGRAGGWARELQAAMVLRVVLQRPSRRRF